MLFVGGVSQLRQGDLDLGRRAVERLAAELGGADVIVEDLYYGAVAVAQRLDEIRPDVLVIVGATPRGRAAATVDVFTITPQRRDRADVQAAVADAVTGYVGTDLLLEVVGGLGTLPRRTVVIDVEPATTQPSPTLSAEAGEALERAVVLVREERVYVGRRVLDELRRRWSPVFVTDDATMAIVVPNANAANPAVWSERWLELPDFWAKRAEATGCGINPYELKSRLR